MNAVPPIISQQPPPLPPSKKPFAFQAAQASLLAPAIAFGIGIVVNVGLSGQSSPLVGIITGSVSILLIVSGFIFGIVALVGVSRYGKKGILGRGIAGVCINGIIIVLMIISIPMYRRMAERAKEIQQQKLEQQQTQQ
jgi:ABC-type molybdate transport system permease subunit